MPEIILKNWYDQAIKKLAIKSSSPDLDARCIIAHVLNIDHEHILAHPDEKINDLLYKKLNILLEKRLSGTPIAYIIKSREFFRKSFYIDERALIPRPETELLVELCVSKIIKNEEKRENTNKNKIIIADICTGSGCIAISISCELASLNIPHHIYATDISDDALTVAKMNASSHKAENNISYIKGDLLDPLIKNEIYPDYIVSNPPYVSEDEYSKSPSIAREPKNAIVSSNKGMHHITQIINQIAQSFKEARVFIEIGALQGDFVKKISSENNMNTIIHKDLAGFDRCAEIFKI